MFGRTLFALLAVALGFGVAVGEDAGGRNINDSNVATLAGGLGDGSASALTVPLYDLNGGIARDAAGNVYYTENSRIFRQPPTGALAVIAGNEDASGFGGDGGPAANATLNSPTILAFDPNGNLFFVDANNNRIRRIGTDGIINSVAGNGQSAGAQIRDIGRPALDAALPGNIVGLGVNAGGDIFFGSSSSSCIYKIAAVDGKLTLLAGNGVNAAANGGVVALANPLGGTIRGLGLAGDGTVIFSADNAIRQIDAAGNNNVIAGLINNPTTRTVVAAGTVFPDDGTLPALQDQSATQTGGVFNPQRIAVDGTTVFFWDNSEGRIRSFTIGGNIQTVFGERSEASNFTFGLRGNGIPAAPNTPHPTMAPFNATLFNDDPLANMFTGGLTAAGGVVAFADVNNYLVRQFTVGGNVVTIAGATDQARWNNTGDDLFSQNISNNAPIAGKGAPLYSVDDVASSTAGVFFSAFDWNSNYEGIYKFDAATSNISLIAGMQYVNGRLAVSSDGGPATAYNPNFSNGFNQMGAFSLLSGGGFMFADPLQPQYLRAVNASGIMSTVAGGYNNNFDLNGDPLPDPLIVTDDMTEFGAGPNLGRVGKSATAVAFLNFSTVLGSSTTDFFAFDNGFGNGNLIQVAGGNVTMDFNVGRAGTLLAQSGNFIFIADYASPNITRIDITTPATPVNDGVFFPSATGNIRGMSMGTRGLYILDTTGNVRLFLPAELTKAAAGFPGVPTAGTNASNLRPNTGNGGFTANGSTLVFVDTGDQIRTLTDSGADAADSFGAAATVAGQFANVFRNGFQLQTNFDFTTTTPVAVQPDGKILVADDGAGQFRLITLGATAGESTFTVALGTGQEGTGTVDAPVAAADNVTVDGIAVDSNGIVYFSDTNTFLGGALVRRVNNGLVETFFGQPTRANLINPGKNRLQSTALSVRGLAFNAANELHIAMPSDAVVVKIVNDVVTLVAGQPGVPGYSGDGFAGNLARLDSPKDVAINANNDVYILDGTGVRLLTNDNIMTSLFTSGESSFSAPNLTIDAAGKVYIGNGSSNPHIHRFSVTEDACCDDDLVLVAGDFEATGWNGDGLPAIRTLFDNSNMDISFDPVLGLLVADSDNARLRAITNLAETTNTPPIAVIVASPSKQGSVPFKVRFDGSSSFDADGDIVKYAWDFGDGKTLTGRVVEHTYTAMGSFVVTLVVTDSKGQTSTTKSTVFAALPLVGTSTTGKGSFKIAFGAKGANKDSFTIVATNVNGLTDQTGKPAKIFIGSFNTTGTVGGKGVKTTSKTVKLVVDIKKKSVALSLKGVELDAAFAELGVLNENIVGGKAGKTVLVPVVIDINNGGLVLGDSFLFTYSTKFNSGASGKYAQ